MRGVLVLALAACSFERGAPETPDDARADAPLDVSPPTWQVDSTSKKGVPAMSFEWSEVTRVGGLTLGVPDHLWLMQETNGALEDILGFQPLQPQNGPSYRNPVLGWQRAAVGTGEVPAERGFITGSLGNLDGSAYLLLLYAAVDTAPTAERVLAGIGAGADHRYVSVTPNPMVLRGNGSGQSATGAVSPMNEVHPIAIKIAPNQMQYIVYTDDERLQVTWRNTAGVSGLLMVGNATALGAANARYLYGALWKGNKAEVDDAEVKRLLTTLGWTVTGY